MRRIAALLTCALLALAPAVTAQDAPAPRVVATIPPIHALTAAVQEGRGEPALLVRGGASPHGYQLRPSDARSLEEADLVVWVGPALETFLERPLASLGDGSTVLTLMEADGVALLEVREGGAWDADHGHAETGARHHGDEGDAAEEHDHGAHDAHIWLSPANARAIVAAVAASLSAVDPAGAALYRANAERVQAKLAELDAELRAQFAPVRDRPFVVFHDAYRYLEKAYGLRAVGSITVSPDRPPSARRMAELAEVVRESGAACVFGEVQTRSPLAASLAEDLGLRLGELDPIGGGSEATGYDAYAAMMRRNAAAIVECLSRGG